MAIKVFYSWQNDTDLKCNRFLIKDATEKAIKELNKEILFESSPRSDRVVLDHDTKGKPGHPEIVNTILENSHSAPYSTDGGLFFWARNESATSDIKDDKDGTSGNLEVSHDDPVRRYQSRRCEFLTDCCGVRQEIRYC